MVKRPLVTVIWRLPFIRTFARGNIIDAWGNPFIFHPIDSQHIEVRSKGPDGEIFTDDDIVVPPPRAADD